MLLARQECTYGAIGMIVGRFVPHITVRKAPPSVAFTDRMSVRMRKRAWPRGTKLRGGTERRGGKCGQVPKLAQRGPLVERKQARFPESKKANIKRDCLPRKPGYPAYWL